MPFFRQLIPFYSLKNAQSNTKRGNFNYTADCYTSLHSSTRIKKRSNLDMMGAVNVIFCFRDFVLSYLPPIGLAAAKMDVLAFKVACNQRCKYIAPIVFFEKKSETL